MYIVTGGAGFIGSALIAKLNDVGIRDIVIVDELGKSEKWLNIKDKEFLDYLHKDTFRQQLEAGKEFRGLKGIVHLGACSSTTESDLDFLFDNNYRYSGMLLDYALSHKVRFIYASSAATYGDGKLGYSDDDAVSMTLSPLNRYGFSKQLFDRFVIKNQLQSKVAGIKFFNVFGPNEAHKGDMRSVVLKSYEQIKSGGSVKLFRSHRTDYRDGEQKRDFIYVKDCCDVLHWLITNPKANGIINLGTGKARSWNDLVIAVFASMGRQVEIEYIDMPESLRNQYQYFTEARMEKLRALGYTAQFRSLEDAVKDYVTQHLELQKIY